jgi:hypothetical protein
MPSTRQCTQSVVSFMWNTGMYITMSAYTATKYMHNTIINTFPDSYVLMNTASAIMAFTLLYPFTEFIYYIIYEILYPQTKINTNGYSPTAYWVDITSSADGNKILAICDNNIQHTFIKDKYGYSKEVRVSDIRDLNAGIWICKKDDVGNDIWEQQTVVSNQYESTHEFKFAEIAMSDDGRYQLAVTKSCHDVVAVTGGAPTAQPANATKGFMFYLRSPNNQLNTTWVLAEHHIQDNINFRSELYSVSCFTKYTIPYFIFCGNRGQLYLADVSYNNSNLIYTPYNKWASDVNSDVLYNSCYRAVAASRNALTNIPDDITNLGLKNGDNSILLAVDNPVPKFAGIWYRRYDRTTDDVFRKATLDGYTGTLTTSNPFGVIHKIRVSDNGKYCIAMNDTTIFYSETYGTSWKKSSPKLSYAFSGFSTSKWSNISMTRDGSYMYAIKENGNIWVSTNRGMNWSRIYVDRKLPASTKYILHPVNKITTNASQTTQEPRVYLGVNADAIFNFVYPSE